MPPHPLPNFEIQKYYQNKPKFRDVYSRDNIPKRSSTEIKDWAYIINLDEYSDIGTHWVALYVGGSSPEDVGRANLKDMQNYQVIDAKLSNLNREVSYTHVAIVNIYIAYELGASSPNDNDLRLKKAFVWPS